MWVGLSKIKRIEITISQQPLFFITYYFFQSNCNGNCFDVKKSDLMKFPMESSVVALFVALHPSCFPFEVKGQDGEKENNGKRHVAHV